MVPEQENVQFGLFTANLHAGELKKGQHTVPLQNLPFRLLAVLLREPGRVFSRQPATLSFQRAIPEGTIGSYRVDKSVVNQIHALYPHG